VLCGNDPRPFVGVANVDRFVRVSHEQRVGKEEGGEGMKI